MNLKFRNVLTQVHRWTGLVVGTVVAFMAITGCCLAIRAEIGVNPQIDPASVESRLRLDTLMDKASTLHPKGRIASIWVPADAPVQFRFDNNDDLYLHPATGEVVAAQHRYGGVFGTIERLHKWAYGEGDLPIDAIPGSVAMALAVILVIGGVTILWPRRSRGWKRAATLDRNLRGRAWLRNLHGVVGLYVGPVLLLVALTGVTLAFDWSQDMVLWLSGSPPPVKAPQSSAPDGRKRLPVEAAWQIAMAQHPDAALTVIKQRPAPRAPVEIYTIDRDAPQANARSYLYLDAYSGDLLASKPYEKASPGQKMLFWAVALHTGLVGGVFGPAVLLVTMAGVMLLFYSGVKSFFQPSIKKR